MRYDQIKLEMLKPRVRGSAANRGFAVRNGFSIYEIHRRVADGDRPLLTPRPVDLLKDMRLSSVAPIDNLILEMMISAAYAERIGGSAFDAAMSEKLKGISEGACILPIRSILALLTTATYGTSQVRDSLERLMNARLSLPVPSKPKRRRSQRFRQIEEMLALYVEYGDGDAIELYESLPVDLDGVVKPAADFPRAYDPTAGYSPSPLSRAVARDEANECLEELHLKVRQGDRPDYRRMIGPLFVSEERAEASLSDGNERFEFNPLLAFKVHGSFVRFALHPQLLSRIDPTRLIGMRRPAYTYLDLRVVAGLKGRYSTPIYRQLVGQSYDQRRKRLRYDEEWIWEPTTEQLAEQLGFAKTSGGLRASLDRSVLKPALAEMAELTNAPRFELLPKRSRFDYKVRTKVSLPIPDDITMLGRRGGRVPYFNMRDLAPTQLKVDNLTPAGLRAVKFQLKLDDDQLLDFTQAWSVAIDETYNLDHADHGDRTGTRDYRQYRGKKLRAELVRLRSAGHTADRAFVAFALEEARLPDLTDPYVIEALRYRPLAVRDTSRDHLLPYFSEQVADDDVRLPSMLDYIDEDRRYRLAQSRGLPPVRVERMVCDDDDRLRSHIEKVLSDRKSAEDVKREAHVRKIKEKTREAKGRRVLYLERLRGSVLGRLSYEEAEKADVTHILDIEWIRKQATDDLRAHGIEAPGFENWQDQTAILVQTHRLKENQKRLEQGLKPIDDEPEIDLADALLISQGFPITAKKPIDRGPIAHARQNDDDGDTDDDVGMDDRPDVEFDDRPDALDFPNDLVTEADDIDF